MAIERKELDAIVLDDIKAEASNRLKEIEDEDYDVFFENMGWIEEHVIKCDRDTWAGEIAYGIHAKEGDVFDGITIWAHLGGVRIFLATDWPNTSMEDIARSVLRKVSELTELPNPLAAIAALDKVTHADLEELQSAFNRDFVRGSKLLTFYRLGDLKIAADRHVLTKMVTVTTDLGWGEVVIFGAKRAESLDMLQTMSRIKAIAMAQLSEFLPEN